MWTFPVVWLVSPGYLMVEQQTKICECAEQFELKRTSKCVMVAVADIW